MDVARGSRCDLSPEQILVLIDCTGWSLASGHGRATLRKAVKLFSRVHPERLGAALVINAGRVVSLLWRVAAPFLPAAMRRKVTLCPAAGGKLRLREALSLCFPDLSSVPTVFGGDCGTPFSLDKYSAEMRREWEPMREERGEGEQSDGELQTTEDDEEEETFEERLATAAAEERW